MKNESYICMHFNFVLWYIQICDFERLTEVRGFDPCVHVLVVAFAGALEVGFLIKATINYSSFELIISKLVAF